MSGLVAAKIVNNPEYETIFKIWCEQLIIHNELNTLKEMQKMYDYLKTYID